MLRNSSNAHGHDWRMETIENSMCTVPYSSTVSSKLVPLYLHDVIFHDICSNVKIESPFNQVTPPKV